MNRRNFLGGLFAILPAAACYKRIWKEIAKTELPTEALIGVNPEWLNAPFEIVFYRGVSGVIPVQISRGGSAGDLTMPDGSKLSQEQKIIEGYPIRLDKDRNPVRPFIEISV